MFLARPQLKLILLIFCLLNPGLPITAQSKQLIRGIVLDKKTRKVLSYASISMKNHSIGTISNNNGEFDFYIPVEVKGDTLVVAYVGYETSHIPIKSINSKLKIKLKPAYEAIDEVYVYPLSPEEYIKRAMAKVNENYANKVFQTMAYFNEEVTENDLIIIANEAIFKSYYPEPADSVKNQHQLLLYRGADENHEISFMKEWREKKIKKAKKKKAKQAAKNGEEPEPDEFNGELFSLGGPETLLFFNIRKQSDTFLDSNNFKRFEYLFGKSKFYKGKNLIVINFNARKDINNIKEKGSILMDPGNYAIISIESKGEISIPVAIKPILFMLGLKVREPVFYRTIKYEQHKGTYYPKDFHWNASIILTKRHAFKTNEYSHIKASQLFFVNRIETDNVSAISSEKLYNPKKKMEEQVYNDGGISWKEMNILKK